MHSDYPLVCRLVCGGFVGMVIVLEEIGEKYAESTDLRA
jgi:hypothetical protein